VALEHCTNEDRRIIAECLAASVEGPFFSEWEFSSLFGMDRRDVVRVKMRWPNVDNVDEKVALAVNNALGNLVGYPHGEEKQWSQFISVTPERVLEVLKRWQQPRQ
jgi:hypothetical protein